VVTPGLARLPGQRDYAGARSSEQNRPPSCPPSAACRGDARGRVLVRGWVPAVRPSRAVRREHGRPAVCGEGISPHEAARGSW